MNGTPGRDARKGVTDENQRSSVEGDPPVSVPPLLGEIWTPGVSTTTIMGCNLCTLQKREEHYRLLYEIAQVSAGTADSGIDLACCFMRFIMHAERRAVSALELCLEYF